MRKQRIFPGVLLIGLGIYLIMSQYSFPLQEQLTSWPSILVIIGISFFVQSTLSKDPSTLFPGAMLTGLGIHFHGQALVPSWPSSWAMYTLIVGLSFLLLYVRTKKEGLFPAMILLLISAIGISSVDPLDWFEPTSSVLFDFWPILLIVIGFILIIKRK
ncbi:LiaI-LiaF-like domain-containing protein [Bacillus sp. FJAT-45037]|uniref:LiaI-LiaF-like domain-containing protein n=1 Tax=Bacillus sp. FJAT-45037 TaxID=2011007 RepID=UPI000C244CAE|nr:DUF5668 domain-containing protein [Bacillus sp. FJAT-45037]